jgi:hypothetical protein
MCDEDFGGKFSVGLKSIETRQINGFRQENVDKKKSGC